MNILPWIEPNYGFGFCQYFNLNILKIITKSKKKASVLGADGEPNPESRPGRRFSRIIQILKTLAKFVILRICWWNFGDFPAPIWWFLHQTCWNLVKFGDFCKIWILVKFEILNPKISKFEILNPNTKISNLDTKFLNFDDFCYKFDQKAFEGIGQNCDAITQIWNLKTQKVCDIKNFLNKIWENLKFCEIDKFDKIWNS